jgi:hypothetical protein
MISQEDILAIQSDIMSIVEFSKIAENELKLKASANENFQASLKYISLQQDILSERSVLQATEILAAHKEKEEKLLDKITTAAFTKTNTVKNNIIMAIFSLKY